MIGLFIYLFIKTYLYRVDIIKSQAIFSYVPCGDFVICKQKFNYIIYNIDEKIYNTDKKRIKVKTHNIEVLPAPKPETNKKINSLIFSRESVRAFHLGQTGSAVIF